MATLGLTESEREAVKRFEADVIAPSKTHLVILDFWAEWCGPCKQLGPILDKVAADYAGKGVKLAKIDIDKEKWIAQQFQIQSIPTVYAFYQGQPVADITNARSEGQIKRMLDQGLIEETEERPDPALDDQRRRYYRLTSLGRRVGAAEHRRLTALVDAARLRHLDIRPSGAS